MHEDDKSISKVYLVLGIIKIILLFAFLYYVSETLYEDVIFREDWKVRDNVYTETKGEYILPVIGFEPKPIGEIKTLVDDRSPQQKIFGYATEIAELYNLEPTLLLAIAEKESHYNPDIVGGGAVGLMQIIPSCHKGRMERLGITDLKDPYQNLLVGADILAQLSKSYDDIGLVLMCYNMGEGGALPKYRNSGYSAYAKEVLSIKQRLEGSDDNGTNSHPEKDASPESGNSRAKMYRRGFRIS